MVDDPSKMLAFFAAHKREPFPKRVRHWADHKRWAGAFWTMIKMRQDNDVGGGIDATIDGNVVTLLPSENVAAVALYLKDRRLLDIDKPVKVVAGDRTLYEGPVIEELYLEFDANHASFWQDANGTGENPHWLRARLWPEPGQPLK